MDNVEQLIAIQQQRYLNKLAHSQLINNTRVQNIADEIAQHAEGVLPTTVELTTEGLFYFLATYVATVVDKLPVRHKKAKEDLAFALKAMQRLNSLQKDAMMSVIEYEQCMLDLFSNIYAQEEALTNVEETTVH